MISFADYTPRKAGQPRPDRSAAEQNAPELVFESVPLRVERMRLSSKSAGRLNDAVALCIAIFLFLAPVPFGANRPLAWLGASAAIALLTLTYTLLISAFDPARPAQFRRHLAVLVPGGVLLLGAVLQLLPIGGVEGLHEELQPAHITFSPSATQLGLIRMTSYAMLFFLILEVCANSVRAERLVAFIFYGVLLHAIWALISLTFLGDTLLFSEKVAYRGYATGTFVNRNSFATYLTMGFIVGLGRLLFNLYGPQPRVPRGRSYLRRITIETVVQAAFLAINFVTLLATGSRLGLVSCLVGSAFLLLAVLGKTKALSGVSAVILVLVFLVVAAVAVVAGGDQIGDRLAFLIVDADKRVELFRQTLAMISERPFLGYGLDSFPIAFELFHSPALSTSVTWEKPHNSYLTLWAEFGVVLGSLPLLITAICFVGALRQMRERATSFTPAAVACSVIVACAIHSLGDFSLEIAANTYVFVALVGIGISRKLR